ncbi:hypothetical protein GCM10009104_23150 [Marinobacterium maritimum]|uniref:Uncharacterized protein n=1 Tax=Marinobacterium maritimum TaxID=500162 RepID=A0ABN1I7H0_9GAMM
MASRAADFSGLKTSLFELIGQKATGTLFIATVDNHAAQIVLSRGQLLGVAHNGLCNEAALSQLAVMAPLRFSFTPDLIYPLMETLLPEQAEPLLLKLGFSAAPAIEKHRVEVVEPAPSPVASSATLRVYRGRVIQG